MVSKTPKTMPTFAAAASARDNTASWRANTSRKITKKAVSKRCSTRVFVSEAKYADVIDQLRARGWQLFPHGLHFPGFALKWTNYCKVNWQFVKPFQIVNHLHHAVVFCHKATFTNALHSRFGPELTATFFPNTFEIDDPDQLQRFHHQFVYYQAIGVLQRCLAHSVCRHQAVQMALQVVTQQDWTKDLDLHDPKWQILFTEAALLQQQHQEEESGLEHPDAQQQVIQHLLVEVQAKDPQFHLVAQHNLWIVKPANLSRGRGIHLVQSLDQIHQLHLLSEEGAGDDTKACGSSESDEIFPVTDSSSGHSRAMPPSTSTPSDDLDTNCQWLIQKYIETPLLIDNRKFDIRQWVLITSLEPLQVYWFDRCYLRFCSRPFSLDTIEDNLIHLTNFSIQKDAVSQQEPDKKQHEHRHEHEEMEMMWSSERFRCFLREAHGSDVWKDLIMPQMQEATQRAILAVKDRLVMVGRGFEWLGLDFMLDETLHVWLLEVNVSPDITHSTNVTSELVPKATSDALDLILEPGDEHEMPHQTQENEWKPLKMELMDVQVPMRQPNASV